jgi:hypothetical protein
MSSILTAYTGGDFDVAYSEVQAAMPSAHDGFEGQLLAANLALGLALRQCADYPNWREYLIDGLKGWNSEGDAS